jgi:hypothetical protein
MSGEWYIGSDMEPDMEQGVIKEAQDAGEPIIRHPYGPLIFRLDWLSDNGEYPEDRAVRESLRRLLELGPPQSRN